MVICFSGKSKPSAIKIADEDSDIELNRGPTGDINWGRAEANTTLNPDISNVTNKRRMRELFKENGVPMPRLIPFGIELNHEVAWGGPVVGRPDSHTRGRGFWRVNNAYELDRAVRGTRRKKAATHFMEYIDAPREYRVHIFKGKSIRISEKEFNEDGYITRKPQFSVKYVRRAAKKAVEAVGLDFGAVDILARGDNNEEVFVLEVNAAPGVGGTMPRVYAKVFKQWEEGEF